MDLWGGQEDRGCAAMQYRLPRPCSAKCGGTVSVYSISHLLRWRIRGQPAQARRQAAAVICEGGGFHLCRVSYANSNLGQRLEIGTDDSSVAIRLMVPVTKSRSFITACNTCSFGEVLAPAYSCNRAHMHCDAGLSYACIGIHPRYLDAPGTLVQ